ncbi:uncharacterized protein LOC124257741 [Haliotis rubra]|uniref:uncharacterized protein LOC124257741 n=1 Tax=Haliotis rubra TaxID=36100 RepID=UPI001EE5E6E1|nr:uncharacterized protein LOC124257741 [Haliotis rubra]
MADAEANCLLRCSVGLTADGPCGVYRAYPKENGLETLGSCCRDISSHLREVNLCGGRQTTRAPAADSEGSLISYRIGLFRYDPSMTVCPYHRYRLGIHWRPPRKCVFPLHQGSQLPYKGVSVDMSETLMNQIRVLVPAGSD